MRGSLRMTGTDYRLVFGDNLRCLAREARVNYETVGKAVNRCPGAVQQWVLGRSQPEYNILVDLAEFFTRKLERHVSINEFFDRQPKLSTFNKSG